MNEKMDEKTLTESPAHPGTSRFATELITDLNFLFFSAALYFYLFLKFPHSTKEKKINKGSKKISPDRSLIFFHPF
jgi:hypothetical protein